MAGVLLNLQEISYDLKLARQNMIKKNENEIIPLQATTA
jgi:hypothetical protein